MLYKALEPEDGVAAQFGAVHLVRWRPEWDAPKLLFVEAERADLLEDARIKALVEAARKVVYAPDPFSFDIALFRLEKALKHIEGGEGDGEAQEGAEEVDASRQQAHGEEGHRG